MTKNQRRDLGCGKKDKVKNGASYKGIFGGKNIWVEIWVQ